MVSRLACVSVLVLLTDANLNLFPLSRTCGSINHNFLACSGWGRVSASFVLHFGICGQNQLAGVASSFEA